MKKATRKKERAQEAEEDKKRRECDSEEEEEEGVRVDDERYKLWQECIELVGELESGRWKHYADSGELAKPFKELWQSWATSKMRVEEALLNQVIVYDSYWLW